MNYNIDSKAKTIIKEILALIDTGGIDEYYINEGKITKEEIDNNRKIIKKLIAKLNKPEELHYLVTQYNWDNGDELIYEIVSNPNCDKGTALMLYYSSQALLYYAQYKDIEDVMNNKQSNWEIDSFKLIKFIESRIIADKFKTSVFSFNADKELREDPLFNSNPKNPKFRRDLYNRIPKECKVNIDGIYPQTGADCYDITKIFFNHFYAAHIEHKFRSLYHSITYAHHKQFKQSKAGNTSTPANNPPPYSTTPQHNFVHILNLQPCI